jgi:outer membrane protein OmpA-like peptidoglycan-associated protein
MTRVERFRLAASLCLVGGSVDAAVLAGWAWPRYLADRGRMATVAMESPVVALRAAPSPPSSTPPSLPPPSPPPSTPAAPSEPSAPVAAAEEPTPTPTPTSAAPPATAPNPDNPPVGIILFRTRAGKHWSDPNKAFERIVELARRDPDVVLRIDGYADHRGDRHDNRHLSLRRARRIARALQSAGCSPTQIVIHGHGQHKARATGHGRGARRWNRRVEIHVHGRGTR